MPPNVFSHHKSYFLCELNPHSQLQENANNSGHCVLPANPNDSVDTLLGPKSNNYWVMNSFFGLKDFLKKC